MSDQGNRRHGHSSQLQTRGRGQHRRPRLVGITVRVRLGGGGVGRLGAGPEQAQGRNISDEQNTLNLI